MKQSFENIVFIAQKHAAEMDAEDAARSLEELAEGVGQ